MSTSIINSTLPNTKPRYTQTNLCLLLLQETEDTQISQKLILLSHNDEDREHPPNPSMPSYKLVFKKATVVMVECNFVWTEGPSSVSRFNSSDTNICPSVTGYRCQL